MDRYFLTVSLYPFTHLLWYHDIWVRGVVPNTTPHLLQFGHGARTCLGKNISMMEMCKLVPKLVRKFDLELADPNAELKTYNVWFVKQTDLKVRVSERKL